MRPKFLMPMFNLGARRHQFFLVFLTRVTHYLTAAKCKVWKNYIDFFIFWQINVEKWLASSRRSVSWGAPLKTVSEKTGEKLGERKPREKKAAFSRRDIAYFFARRLSHCAQTNWTTTRGQRMAGKAIYIQIAFCLGGLRHEQLARIHTMKAAPLACLYAF